MSIVEEDATHVSGAESPPMQHVFFADSAFRSSWPNAINPGRGATKNHGRFVVGRGSMKNDG
jgi:hypothetical protein